MVPALLAVLTVLAVASPATARRIAEVLPSYGNGATAFQGNSLMRFDAAGNLYVLSNSNSVVFKVTPAGAISVLIRATGDGMGNPLTCGGSVCDLLVTAGGHVYVTGAESDNVFHIDPGGTITEILDASGDGSGNALDRPGELAMDSAGNLYVSGYVSNKVFKVTPGGAVSVILDASGDGLGHTMSGPWGMGVDAADNVLVVATISDNVFKITSGGSVTQILGPAGDGLGHGFAVDFDSPVFDGANNAYIVSRTTNAVFKVTPGGMVTSIIDAAGDGAGHTLNDPVGLAIDATGRVYVSGVFTHLFRIDTGGTVTWLGDFTSDIAWLFTDATATKVYLSNSTGLFRIADGGALQPLLDLSGDGTRPVGSYVIGGTAIGNAAYVEAYGPSRVLRVEPLCDPTPRAGCHGPTVPGAAKLTMKDLADDTRDNFSWRWTRGEETLPAEFGDPASLDYNLCFYQPGSSFAVFELSATAGGPCVMCWSPKGSGFQYRDLGYRAPDGIVKMVLIPGSEGSARMIVKAKGVDVLDVLALPLTDFPLTVQLQASNGACWDATYSAPGMLLNTDSKLKAQSD